MVYLPMHEILEKSGSIYKLVILASLRTQELNNGAPPLIEYKETDSKKLSTVAMEEIIANKISYKQK